MALACLALVLPPVSGVPHARADTAGLHVSITQIDPAVLGPDDALVVSGEVTNLGAATLSAPVVELRLQAWTPTARSALTSWLDEDSARVTRRAQITTLPTELEPGASVDYELTVDLAALGASLTERIWGGRGIEVLAHADGVEDRALSIVVLYPDVEPVAAPLALTVLAPVTLTGSERAESLAEGTALTESASRRLEGLVGAAGRKVTWALDPSLLLALGNDESADGEDGGDPDDTAPGDDDEPATSEGASAVAEALSGHEVLALPFADADVAAIGAADAAEVLELARARGQDLLDQAGVSAVSDLAWPEAGHVSAATAETVALAGYRGIILPNDAVEQVALLQHTPTGRVDVTSPAAVLDGILVDSQLSSLLLPSPSAATVSGTTSSHLDAATLELASSQMLLAQTALISRERPEEQRAVLAALDREAVGRLDDDQLATLATRLASLAQAPWIEMSSLAELWGRPVTGLSQAGLGGETETDDDGSRAAITAAAGLMADVGAFAEALSDPESETTPVLDSILEISSTAWRSSPRGRGAAGELAQAQVSRLRQGVVAIPPGSQVNLIAEQGTIPIVLTNAFTQEVMVDIELTSSDPLLQVESTSSVTLAAAPDGALSTTTVRTPVTAIANGDVTVRTQLLSPSGAPLGPAQEFDIRVRADWENRGTAIAAAALGVLLVIGLTRTIRRGRRTAGETA